VYTTDFPLAQSDPSLVALGLVMMGRLDQFTRDRQRNAALWLEGLRTIPGLQIVNPPEGATAVYLRLPVLLPDAATRATVIAALTGAGIGATSSYPRSLADVPEVRQAMASPATASDGGRSVAGRILTLPTHPFVTRADILRATALIQRGIGARCAA
jgi:dTDP-4-amino-4,6-dideoxygalactose transaminase